MSTISWPSGLLQYPDMLHWSLRANTQSFASPLNGEVETLELPGARWACRITLPPLRATAALNDAGYMAAFVARLRGQANRAALYNFKRPTPLGTINTSGVTLSGAVAAGASSCSFAGVQDGKTLLPGDFFSVAGELKMVVDGPHTMVGSPQILGPVSFEPVARAAWSDAAAVTLDKPTALFILESSEAGWRSSVGDVTEFDLAFVEAFA